MVLQASGGGREEPASVFQHRRVGALLEDLQTKFPYKYPTQTAQQQQQQQQQTPQASQQGTQQTAQQEGTKLGMMCVYLPVCDIQVKSYVHTVLSPHLLLSSFALYS